MNFTSDVSIDAPLELDISRLRGNGMQPGEESLPQEQSGQQEEPGKQALFAAPHIY